MHFLGYQTTPYTEPREVVHMFVTRGEHVHPCAACGPRPRAPYSASAKARSLPPTHASSRLRLAHVALGQPVAGDSSSPVSELFALLRNRYAAARELYNLISNL